MFFGRFLWTVLDVHKTFYWTCLKRFLNVIKTNKKTFYAFAFQSKDLQKTFRRFENVLRTFRKHFKNV